MTPIAWYASMELRQGTQDWEEISKQFLHIFEFTDGKPIVDVALQTLKAQIFSQVPIIEENSHQRSGTIQ